MAKSPVCSIDECGKPVWARGWCRPHYKRWERHGNPLAGRTAEGETARFFQTVVLSHRSDDCLIWPYGRAGRGYGLMTLNGKRGYAHRFACEARNGPPPSKDAEAAHSCGNGHLGCVNQIHLRWATTAENHADKIDHGTTNRGERHGNSKLTTEDVLKIRSLSSKISRRDLALMFGINTGTVNDIIRRKSWCWL